MKSLRAALERFLDSDNPGLLTPLAGALTPLAWLNARLQKSRRASYRTGKASSVHPGVPTVCVGNITAGGTGKTPLVEEVCALFKELGLKPAVISRGYGGALEGSVAVVCDGSKILLDAAQAGDEPVLLARRLGDTPVVISAKRINGARLAIDTLGAQALVLDDGYQHLKLARDLDIVVLDAARPFGNGNCLPRGLLREPPSALADAGALVLTRADGLKPVDLERVKSQLRQYNRSAPIIVAAHRQDCVVEWPDGERSELEWLEGKKLVAFAGIGKPAAFFGQLEEAGAQLVYAKAFADHHAYTAAELCELTQRGRKLGAAALITTEKDAVRLHHFLPLELPLKVVPLRVEITQADRDTLKTLLKGVIDSHR